MGKCLEKDREKRYSSARELLADLKNPRRDLEVGASATVARARRGGEGYSGLDVGSPSRPW